MQVNFDCNSRINLKQVLTCCPLISKGSFELWILKCVAKNLKNLSNDHVNAFSISVNCSALPYVLKWSSFSPLRFDISFDFCVNPK